MSQVASEQSKDLGKAIRGSGTNYLAALLQLGIFVFHTLAARMLGKLAYGAYIFAWSIIEIANKLAVAGLDKGIMRSVATARANHDRQAELRALATALRMVGLVSCTVLALVLLLAGPIADLREVAEYAPALRALAPLVVLWSVMMVLINATMATRTMRYNLLVRGIADPLLMISAILAYAVLWDSGGGVAIALAHVTAACATMLLAFRAFGKLFDSRRIFKGMFRKKTDSDLIRFSIPVGLAELLNQAIYRVDVIMIGILLGDPLQVANYGACILLSNTISSIRYAFDPILSPVVAETVVTKDNARLSYNLKMMVRWVTLLGLPLFVAMIVFGDVLLTLWGPSYSEAFPALIILAIGHLVNAVLGLHQWPIVMSGRSKLDLFNNALAFAINIILNIVLIPIWGLAGAATATLVGNIVFRSLQAIQVGIIFRIHAFSIYWLRILVAVGLAVAVQIGIRVLVVGPPGFIVFLFATLIGMVVYFFVYLALGATPEDKQIVSRIMGRFRRKQ